MDDSRKDSNARSNIAASDGAQSNENKSSVDKQFERLLESCTAPMLLVDASDRTVVKANRPFEDISGYPADEISGRKAIEISEEIDNLLINEIARIGSASNESIEIRLNCNGGLRKVSKINATEIVFAARHCLAIFFDGPYIEQKTAESSSKELFEEYRLFLEYAGESVFVLDREGRYVFMNRKTAQGLGGNPEDFVGKKVSDLFPEDVARQRLGIAQEVFRNGKGMTLEVNMPFPDGERWFLSNLQPIRKHEKVDKVMIINSEITDRVEIEKELRRSEKWFSTTLQSIGEAVISTDIEGKISFMNFAAESLTGWKREEAIGEKICDLLKICDSEGEISRDDKESMLNMVLKGGETIRKSQERNVNSKTGDETPVSLTVTPIRQPGGIILGAVIIMQDLTFRLEAEKRIRESEEKYRELIETQVEGIGITDPQENFIFSNPAADKIFGVYPDTITGKNLEDFVSEETIKMIGTETEMRKKGQSSSYEMEILTPSGDKRFLLVSAAPKYDENMNYVRTFAVFRDITDRIIIENELIEKTANMQSLIENTNDMIWSLDNNYTILTINSNTKKVAKAIYDIEYAIGDNAIDKLPVSDRNDWKYMYDRCLGGEHFSEEAVFYAGNKEMVINIAFNPIYLSNGAIVGLTCFARDISELKQKEKEREDLIEELKVEKDTIEDNANELVRLNHDLSESEENLQRLNASKDKFFSIIAHDLRGPLAGFIGLSETLANDFEQLTISEMHTMSKALHDSSNRLNKLLNNLLEWSRAQTGRIKMKFDILDIHEYTERSLSLHKANANRKSIELINHIPAKTNVYGDAHSIETVMRNLISNAIKFTKENGRIEIFSDIRPEYTEIAVYDNGVGMEKKEMEKLFKIDQVFSKPGTGNEKGSGLGLLLCKELLEKHAISPGIGQITVESMIGKGTTFRFTLPNWMQ